MHPFWLIWKVNCLITHFQNMKRNIWNLSKVTWRLISLVSSCMLFDINLSINCTKTLVINEWNPNKSKCNEPRFQRGSSNYPAKLGENGIDGLRNLGLFQLVSAERSDFTDNFSGNWIFLYKNRIPLTYVDPLDFWDSTGSTAVLNVIEGFTAWAERLDIELEAAIRRACEIKKVQIPGYKCPQ